MLNFGKVIYMFFVFRSFEVGIYFINNSRVDSSFKMAGLLPGKVCKPDDFQSDFW